MSGPARSVPGVDTDTGEDVLDLAERHLAAGTWRHTLVLPRSGEGPGEQLYYSLPCSLSEQELDQMLRRELGAGLEVFRRLTRARLISGECHRLVAAMVISRCGLTSRQAQALIGDHLYIIGEPGQPVAKVGRSADVRRRLRDLTRASPAPLVIRHVEPGLGPAERLVHDVLGERRLHSEWFDFSGVDPRSAVRSALLSLDQLAWLRGMGAAIEDAAGERGPAQLARARQVVRRALAVERQIERRRAALLAQQQEKAAAADYDALREQARSSVLAAARKRYSANQELCPVSIGVQRGRA
jgi:hypothetical protein